MKKYLKILKTAALFNNIDEKDLEQILGCLNSNIKAFEKDSVIFLTGDSISQVGIVLSGTAQVIKEDYLGNRTILTELSAGELFAEVFACAEIGKFPVTVLTATGCEVLMFDYKKIVGTCAGNTCVFHSRLIENMLKLLASKNLMLNQKIEILSKRSIREKIMTYFAFLIEKTKCSSFELPFSRQELADYLCADRSAMSRELCKMRDEGLLRFKGNKFDIL